MKFSLITPSLGSMSAPLKPLILPRNLDSVMLSWTAPIDVFECIDRYIINLANITEERIYTLVTDNSATSKIVEHLAQGVEYAFVVTGFCEGSVSQTSLPSNRFTLDGKRTVSDVCVHTICDNHTRTVICICGMLDC